MEGLKEKAKEQIKDRKKNTGKSKRLAGITIEIGARRDGHEHKNNS